MLNWDTCAICAKELENNFNNFCMQMRVVDDAKTDMENYCNKCIKTYKK